MKRVLAIVFLSLLVMQFCLLPMAVTAKCNDDVSTVTLPVTNFTDSSATLIGTWTSVGTSIVPLYVSFQYGTVPGVYNSETPQIEKSLSEIGTFPFQANISGLSPCTTYYVRTQLRFDGVFTCDNYIGNVVSFQTTGCLQPQPPPAPINPLIGTGAPTSHGSTKLTFNVSRSEPGDYSVYVDGVPAGSFKVELFRESDGILIFSAILVALAFLIGMVMLWRRQKRTV